jgi:hypothetical protein
MYERVNRNSLAQFMRARVRVLRAMPATWRRSKAQRAVDRLRS